jgi:hypothetical protein
MLETICDDKDVVLVVDDDEMIEEMIQGMVERLWMPECIF